MNTYNFYATQWAPNGTSDLIITDSDHQILGCVTEALFGVPDRLFHPDGFGGSIVLYGDDVGYTSEPEQHQPEDIVAGLTEDMIDRYLAVSPVQSESDVRAAIAAICK